jgi:hypothetical protein
MAYPKRVVSTPSYKVGEDARVFQDLVSWFDTAHLGKVKLKSFQLFGKQGQFREYYFPYDMRGFSQHKDDDGFPLDGMSFIGGCRVDFCDARFTVNFDLLFHRGTGDLQSAVTYQDDPAECLDHVRVILELTQQS